MQACLHAVTARDLKKVISAQMGSGTSYSFHPGAILLFNFLGYCLSCSGARAHRSSRSRPGLKIVTPGTVGRFIDRLGFKILLKLPGLVVLVLLQERAAGEPNSNPVPWSIAAAALWVHPHPNGRLAFARGSGDTLCPGTSVSREA